ncbi:MAG: hypothetical protein ACO1RX_03515 [Candidatus Sericytochromatia bacterium]
MTGFASIGTQTLWNNVVQDQRFSPKELNDMKAHLRSENPQISDAEMRQQLTDLLTWSNNLPGPEQAAQILDRLEQGETVQVGSFAAHTSNPSELSFDVSGAQITDANGVTTAASDDLTGSIASASLSVPLDTAKARELLKQVEPMIREGFTRQISAEAAEAVIRNLEVRQVERDGRTEYQVSVNPAVRDQLSWADSAALKAGEIGAWTSLTDGPQVRISTTDAGQLAISAAGLIGSSLNSDEMRTVQPTRPRQSTRQEATGRTQLEAAIETQARAMGLDVDVVRQADGSHVLNPKSLTLSGEQLRQYPQLAHLGAGQVTLTPEQFSVKLGPNGLDIQIRDIALRGGSDAAAQPVAANPTGETPTQLSVDRAQGSVTLSDRGAVEGLSLSELSGRLEGDVTVSNEVLEVVQQKVQTALADLDKKLTEYGLNREQLSKLVGQVPSDVLSRLMTSANAGEVAQTAQRFGLDGQTLNSAVRFLREQPVQQMIEDLNTLSKRLAVDTHLEGGVDFKLSDLKLSSSDQGFLGQLGALSLTSQVQATAPDGTQTDLRAEASVQDARVEQTPDGVTTAAGPTEVSVSAQSVPGDNPVAPQIDAFTTALASGGGEYRARTDTRGREDYLEDGASPAEGIRARKGLPVASAHAEMAKATSAQWAAILDKSKAEQEAFFAQHGIANNPPEQRGNYLVQYLNRYVVERPRTESAEATLGFQRAEVGPGGVSVDAARAEARVSASDGAERTDLTGGLSIDSIRGQNGELRAEGIATDAQAVVTETGGQTTQVTAELGAQALTASAPAPATVRPVAPQIAAFQQTLAAGGGDYRVASGPRKDYLVDEPPQQIRSKNGVQVATALSELSKASPEAWSAALDGDAAARTAFYSAHGIQPALGDYLTQYLRQKVVDRSETPQGGIQAEGVTANATLHAEQAGHDPVDASIAGAFDRIHAGPGAIQAEDGQLSGALTAGNTAVRVGTAPGTDVRTDADGIDATAQVNWEVRTGTQAARVDLAGSTEVRIEDGQLAGTRTEAADAGGSVRTGTQTLLRVLEQSNPDLARFFKEKGILGDSRVKFDVTNTGAIETNAQGQLTNYQLRASTGSLQTSLGNAQASMYLDDNGSITGDVLIANPSRQLTQMVQDSLNQAIQNIQPPPDARVTGVTINNGKVEVQVQGRQVVKFAMDLDVTTTRDGNIRLDIKSTDLTNGFLNALSNGLGIDLERRSARTLQEALAEKFTVQPNGDYGMTLNTQELIRSMFGDQAQGVRITPSLTAGGLNLRYNVN